MKNQQNMINGKQIIRKPMTADEFNDLIFEIVGLDTTDEGIVIDADYNTIIAIKQKYMTIYPENESFDTIVYDPARNPSIMDKTIIGIVKPKFQVTKHITKEHTTRLKLT